jgi:NADH-quinone oxidoreductase subunit M
MDPQTAAAAAAALLPALLAVPILGAILVMLIPRGEDGLARGVGMGFSILAFAVSLAILGPFKFEIAGLQLVFDAEWIPLLGSRFKLGVDGISIWLVLLTTFLTPVVLLSAHGAIKTKVREFVAIILVLEAGMLGAFLALDLFLFYIFWEVMLIPMYLLIGIWGGQRRLYASIKFVIYTMIGSLLMLVAIFYVYAKYGAVTGEYTTDFMKLKDLTLPHSAQIFCFAAFALAFAIKVPLFPLHTWLPDAHVEAPTAGSVILAGVLLKFGIYGFLRFAMPMFPHGAAAAAPYIAILAVAGIIYGALVAFAQTDVKKLVAYSSVSHLGFCVLGVFALTAQGIEGSIFAMLSHGLTTSGLFLAIGVLYERRHTREMSEFGGLWKKMPVFGGLFLLCVLGSAGLPGLSGFVGEFLTIIGTWISGESFPEGYSIPYPRLLAALAATGVILGAVYLLYMFQKVMFGPLTNDKNRELKDVSVREILVFVPVIALIFAMGIFPQPFLKAMDGSVNQMMYEYRQGLEEPDGPARLRGTDPASVRPSNAAPSPGADAGDKPKEEARLAPPAGDPAAQPSRPGRPEDQPGVRVIPAPRQPGSAPARRARPGAGQR